jgi:MGT family glycosyltransferase
MTTYLFTLVDGGGTVPPEVGTVRRLVDRGHRVVVLAEDSMAADVLASGAELRPWTTAPNRASRLPEDDPYRDWECKNPIQLFDRLLEKQFVGPAARYVADTTAAIEDVRPDLVVSGYFTPGALIAAEAAEVPYDVLIPNPYVLPAPGMPPFGMGLRPATNALGRLRDRAIHAFTGRLWAKATEPLNELRTSLGLAPNGGIFDQILSARRVLVLTSAAFDFPAELPGNVRYVGAVLDDPAWAEQPWTAPPGDAPLVLVALSSTFQDHAGCLQRIVDGLATLSVRAVVTTGPALDPGAVTAPANISVVAAAPHSAVLREAAAVVTHGGHGTVVRALAAGVPALVLPHGRDQADNAARLTSRGAGLQLKNGASPKAIASAVRQLLAEPKFRTDAERLGETIRRDAASGAAVAELEDLPAAVGPQLLPAAGDG